MFSTIIVISLQILVTVLLIHRIKLYKNSKKQLELETKKTTALYEEQAKLVL